MRRSLTIAVLLFLATTTACRQNRDTRPDDALAASPTEDSLRRDALGREAAADSEARTATSVRVDTTTARADSARAGARPDSTVAKDAKGSKGSKHGTSVGSAVRDSTAKPAKRPWPTGPAPRPGALLPGHRIVAFYGNPLTTKLGVLGRIANPERMLDSLAAVARSWQRADTSVIVKPALHLIAAVAAGHPGTDGKYRTRMSDSTIARVARWADQRGYLMFVDLQVGQSSVASELEWIKPWLARPNVHLALDPEFAMARKVEGHRTPGKYIGTMDASEINHAVAVLAHLVDSLQLPPKILVVHRFTDDMLTNAPQIRPDPRVQVVIDMDGFGSPALKKAAWRRVILREPVQFTGWKLFYNPKNDKPMMKPKDVLELDPAPLYIQYQ